MNEELHIVNAELGAKVEELDRANSDLRNVFESTQVATIFLDRNLIIRHFTPAVGDLYNLIPSDLGRPLTDIVSQLDYDNLGDDLAQVLDRLAPLERRVAHRNGQTHYLMRILPYRGGNNAVEGVLVTFVDVTTIVLAEQHHRLLVDELNHRVKNMLTVVISLATQTLRGARSTDDFSKAFLGRLHALSAAYTLLSRERWTEVSLGDVLAEELAPYLAGSQPGGSAAIAVQGPPVFLRPKAALAIGMVVHELATNAVKYGALSHPGGHVEIRWDIAHANGAGELRWRWTERDGPPAADPSQRGFGTTLIDRTLRHELNGQAELRYASEGLEAMLTIPLDQEVVSATPTGGAETP